MFRTMMGAAILAVGLMAGSTAHADSELTACLGNTNRAAYCPAYRQCAIDAGGTAGLSSGRAEHCINAMCRSKLKTNNLDTVLACVVDEAEEVKWEITMLRAQGKL
jgi:hypothetical protein